MKFKENDNFNRVFGRGSYGCDAKELDVYMDCIEKNKALFEKIRTTPVKGPSAGIRIFPYPTGVDHIIEDIAKANKIDYGRHSGTSFMGLSLRIKAIVDAGGRDAYITSKLSAPALQ